MKPKLLGLALMTLVSSSAIAKPIIPDLSSETIKGFGSLGSASVATFEWAKADGEPEFPADAIPYVLQYEGCFPAKDIASIEQTKKLSTDLTWKKIKNINRVMNQFMKVTGKVTQIVEDRSGSATSFHLIDNEFHVWEFVILGSIDVYEDDYVTVYGLPLYKGSFENMAGSQTEFIRLLGGFVDKE